MASELFAGQYTSAFKGKGMEFSEVREYQPGDDVRDIDWNVTARFGHPFVKVYSEERELTVLLLVDVSPSHLFGTRKAFKRELAAEVAGLLAFVAIRTNDKVGAILFSNKVERFIPPRKGAGHVWGLIREIFAHPATPGVTDLSAPLEYLSRVVRRHAIAFMISDFMTPSYGDGLKTALSLASRKHDVTAVRIQDPAERVLPDLGLAWLIDPETGKKVAVNTSSKSLRRKWSQEVEKRDAEFSSLLAASRVDLVDLFTDRSVVEPLTVYFRKRETRL